jgi:hypothetical protein
MPTELVYFNAADRLKLGDIAEAARGFMHVRPCTRGQFDTWQTAIKSLEPTPDPPVEAPEPPRNITSDKD